MELSTNSSHFSSPYVAKVHNTQMEMLQLLQPSFVVWSLCIKYLCKRQMYHNFQLTWYTYSINKIWWVYWCTRKLTFWIIVMAIFGHKITYIVNLESGKWSKCVFSNETDGKGDRPSQNARSNSQYNWHWFHRISNHLFGLVKFYRRTSV